MGECDHKFVGGLCALDQLLGLLTVEWCGRVALEGAGLFPCLAGFFASFQIATSQRVMLFPRKVSLPSRARHFERWGTFVTFKDEFRKANLLVSLTSASVHIYNTDVNLPLLPLEMALSHKGD